MEEQLRQLIEISYQRLVEAKIVANEELINNLNILIAEAEVQLKEITDAD